MWGYYQLPYCYGMTNGTCGNVGQDDAVQWLWNAADVVFPEIYQPQYDVNLTAWTELVTARTREAIRVMGQSATALGRE